MTGDTPQPIRLDGPHARIVDDDDLLGREAEIVARVQSDPLLAVAPAPAARRPALAPSRRPVLGALLAAARWERDVMACADDVRDALDRVQAEAVRARLDDADRATLIARVQADLREWEIRDCRPLVRAVLGAAQPASDDAEPRMIELRVDEPSAEPVDGAALLAETAAAVRRYVVVTEEQATAIALWVGMTYAIDALAIAPILLATAATARAGKTTLCIVVAALTPRPILLSSVSAAVLYRLVEGHRPTLIGDEADTWLTDERSELRGILNAGHTRATATVARCVGDDHEVRLYSCWCARMLSMIGRPPGTILDRSIVIELRRRTRDEPIARLRQDRIEDELATIRRQWRRWADDHADAIRESDPDMPPSLHDRAADCWRSLIAIADLAGGDWPARARAAAVKLSGEQTDEAIGIELLDDIRTIYDDRDVDRMNSTELAAALAALADRPWAEWSRGRPLTAAKLARLLRPYGVHPTDARINGKVGKSYSRRALTDAWSRYLPEKAQHRNAANNDGPRPIKTEAQHETPCCTLESATNPITTGANRDSCGVAVSGGESGPESVCEVRDGEI